MAETDEKQTVAPYVSWSTFRGLINSLRTDMPAAIDKSVLREGRSGQQAYELDAALRFLKLKNDDDTPTELLSRLVSAGDNLEPVVLRDILTRAYEPKLKLADLRTMTQKLIQERMAQFGNTGHSLRKARKFVLEAARTAGVELSPRLKVRATPMRRVRGSSRRKAETAREPGGNGAGSGYSSKEVGLLEEILKRHKANPDGLDQWLEGMLFVMKKQQG